MVRIALLLEETQVEGLVGGLEGTVHSSLPLGKFPLDALHFMNS